MILPTPPEKLDRQYFQLLISRLEDFFRFVYSRDKDVVITPGTRLVLVAPNGTKYSVKVANDGSLSTEMV